MLVCDWPQAVRPEFSAGPQPLQVLHISEEEKDVLAFRMGLKQPVCHDNKYKQPSVSLSEPLV